MDRSRIETHIKPLLGPRLVSNLTLRDVEAMQADIAAGKSAREEGARPWWPVHGRRLRRGPGDQHLPGLARARHTAGPH